MQITLYMYVFILSFSNNGFELYELSNYTTLSFFFL